MNLVRLREQLIRDEGIRLSPYRDSRGFLTIGIGHNLDAKPLSRRAISVIFEDDVADVVREVADRLPWFDTLDKARQGVLLNMAFQMGVEGMLGFTKALNAMRLGLWQLAADEMLESAWHRQTPERCERLARQVVTGEWQ